LLQLTVTNMFYSESLLAKTGPLARVWLASNLERKLTKQNVLQSDLENNVKDIIGQGQAPMALRLSGQLLLGVVRIYSRKARYLLDDCSEALTKIKHVRTFPLASKSTYANLLLGLQTWQCRFAGQPVPHRRCRRSYTPRYTHRTRSSGTFTRPRPSPTRAN
jgi:hypothetical protein